MAFIMTRVQVGDFDAWKPIFDQDPPGARKAATGYRLFRNVEDPNEVFVQVEFGSAEDAKTGRDRPARHPASSTAGRTTGRPWSRRPTPSSTDEPGGGGARRAPALDATGQQIAMRRNAEGFFERPRKVRFGHPADAGEPRDWPIVFRGGAMRSFARNRRRSSAGSWLAIETFQ